ncbi:MAG: hypothetical protein ACRD18_05125 [Terriglobia bacterium]
MESRIGRTEIDEAARVSVWQRSDEYRIDQTEDGRACTDPQGQGKYAGDREARTPAQGAQAVSQAMDQVVNKREISLFATCQVHLLCAAQLYRDRWSPRRAHLLLQVRTQVLNGEYRETFGRWYPGMKSAPEMEKQAA